MNDIEKNEAERRLRDQRNEALARTPATVAALRRLSSEIDAMAGELARLTKERDELRGALELLRDHQGTSPQERHFICGILAGKGAA